MPPKFGYGFRSRAGLARAVKGIRNVEKLLQSAPEDRYPAGVSSTGRVVVMVTDVMTTSPGIPSDEIINPYPDESLLPENDLYPGVIMYRDAGAITEAARWYTDSETCLVHSINDEPLQVGRRYLGDLTENRNGTPLVLVDTLSVAVCPVYGSLRAVTGNYTATWEDDILQVNAAGGSITVTLPNPTGRDAGSDMFTVKRIDASGNTVTVDPTGAITIDGVANKTLAQWGVLRIYHDGTNYFLG